MNRNPPFPKIQVIINPAAGQNEPILNTLNQVFRQHQVDWQVAITQGPEDAQRLAEEAVAAGVDLVAGYGGDGTLMEIANGLRESGIPLGILPGGTGNSVAREFGIPPNLAQAAELLCQSPTIRPIDVGQVNGRYFLLHIYTGMRASQRATRDAKDSWGIFAYLLSALRVMTDPRVTNYSLTVDGVVVEEEGIVCIAINMLGLGLPFMETVNPVDGMLDVIIIKKAALAALPRLFKLEDLTSELLGHWQGQEITLHTDVAQTVWLDGEAGGETPFTAVIVPEALQVVVPTD